MDPPATAGMCPQTRHRLRLQEAVQRYQRPLVAYARSLTGDLERARDAAQDTLLTLCRQTPDRFENHISPRLAAWLFTVCRNRVIDMHRKDQRMTSSQTLDLTANHASPSPAELADHHDQHDHLLRLIADLPNPQREVVQLRFSAGLPYRDIAQVTGHSVSHVGVLLHQAIKQLRAQMTQLNA